MLQLQIVPLFAHRNLYESQRLHLYVTAGLIVEQIPYSGLARPSVFVHFRSTPREIDEKVRSSLLLLRNTQTAQVPILPPPQRDVPASRPTSEFGLHHRSSIIRDVVFLHKVLRF